MSSSPVELCITVDMEPDCPPYLWTWRGIEEALPELLDVLASDSVRATFFTTGDTALKFPDAVRAVVDAGHELACHGMSHRDFSDLSDDEGAWEIARSLEILREFAPVGAFRAPYLRLPHRFLPVLERHGITVDASLARYKWHPGHRSAQPTMARVPASITSSFLRLPAIIRDPLLRRLRSPIVLFVHPWEFVDWTRTSLRWDCRFRTGAQALELLRTAIRLLKSGDTQVRPISELAKLRPHAERAATSR